MSTKVSDEMLMAFVDGELDPETAARIRDAMAEDAELAQRADAFRASRKAAREAFAGIRSEPAPSHLIEAIMRGTSARDRPLGRRRDFMRATLPLAASLALIAGVGGYLLGQAGAPEAADLLGGAGLAQAVGTTPSGEERSVRLAGQEVVVRGLATYPVDGGVCRMFEAAPAHAEAIRGVGCRFAERWHIDVAVAIPADDGLVPAADNAAAVLDAYLDARGAGPALSREEDAETHGE